MIPNLFYLIQKFYPKYNTTRLRKTPINWILSVIGACLFLYGIYGYYSYGEIPDISSKGLALFLIIYGYIAFTGKPRLYTIQSSEK